MQRRNLAIVAILLCIVLILTIILYPDTQEFGEEICDLQDNDGDGEIDEGFVTTCSSNVDCGESGPYGETFCRNDNVYSQWYQTRCSGEVGTCQSSCTGEFTEKEIRECTNGCRQGRCL